MWSWHKNAICTGIQLISIYLESCALGSQKQARQNSQSLSLGIGREALDSWTALDSMHIGLPNISFSHPKETF